MMEKQNAICPGTRFGRWTVMESCPDTPKGERKWLCRCDCGTERTVLERALKYGGSQSCGCLRKERAAESVSHDLSGKTFGDLTVLSRAEHQPKNGGIWWHCVCACGNTYDVSGTLLVTGRRTHCPSAEHQRKYAAADITGQKFERLTALYPTDKRDSKGSVVWHCRCDCGNETEVSYNQLVYSHMQSCGCKKKEHDEKLKDTLIHIDGTSLDMIRSRKIPSDNTTGHRGVYLIRGKYVAKIVFQKKAYYLGTYPTAAEAAQARKEAEEILFNRTVEYYRQWKELADADPDWAEENPIRLEVSRDSFGELQIRCLPDLEEAREKAAEQLRVSG